MVISTKEKVLKYCPKEIMQRDKHHLTQDKMPICTNKQLRRENVKLLKRVSNLL